MSGMISKTFISGLLERCDIVDVIGQRVPLKKKGANHMACCPFHNEKSPSFSVNQNKQFYHCFGCGVSGDAIAFLMEFERLSFVEAIEQLAKSVGIEVIYEKGSKPKEIQYQADIFQLMEKIAKFYQQAVMQSRLAQDYLSNRGLSQDIIALYQIGYAPEGWRHVESICGKNSTNQKLLIEIGMLIQKDQGQPYDRFRHRIMFPIRNRRGQIVGFGGRSLGDENPKYLNSPESSIYHKGQELYGLFEAQNAIRDAQKIIVVEGYMDAIALAQFGIPYVAATLGTAATSEHLKLLLRYAPHIIFCFDGDNAGRKAAWRALENALAFVHEGIKIQFCFLPDNEDPDSYLHHFGQKSFVALVEKAIPLSEFLFSHLTEKLDLSTIEGKNELTQKVKPLLQKMTKGVFQQLLMKQLAAIVRMDESAIANLVGISLPLLTKSKPHKAVVAQDQPAATPMRSAMTLLLQYPELIKYIDNIEDFTKLSIPGKELFLDMLELIKSRPNINTAAILQHFSEHPQCNALKKLATRELFYVENGLIQEFIDSINRLKKTLDEQEVEQLLRKAKMTGLSSSERERLQLLIHTGKKRS